MSGPCCDVRCICERKGGRASTRTKRSNALPEVGEVLAEAKAKRKRDKRSKKWQLTENNADYGKREAVERLSSIGQAQYAISCEEVGESGTRHIHAFVVYKNAIELGSLKRLFPRAHFETCKGSINDNVDYISKDDASPYEVGEKPLVVSEWNEDVSSEVVALILAGLGPIEILKEYPRYCDYVVRNFRNLCEIYESVRIRRK